MIQLKALDKIVGLSLSFALVFTTFSVAMAQTQTPIQQSTTSTTPQSQMLTLPAGTVLSIRETSFAGNPGEAFTGQLVNPVRMNGMVVLPSGSTVQGQVVSAEPSTNQRTIQLSNITLPAGNVVAFHSSINTPMPSAQAAVRMAQPLSGQVSQSGSNTASPTGMSMLYPRISMGPTNVNPAVKVIGSTAAGTLFGAATGTLAGLTIGATSSARTIRLDNGSMAVRGLAWGSAYGAGFGLLSGLIAAATTPSPVAVTSTQSGTGSAQATGQVFNVALAQPVTLNLP